MVMREGRVLVEMDYVIKNSLDINGVTLHLANKSSESQYDFSNRTGKVVKVSEQSDIPYLNYSFKGDVEVQPGDTVWWSKMAVGRIIRSAKKELVHFVCEGKDYYEIHYKELILRKRGDHFLGLNDRVVGKKIEPEPHPFLDLSLTKLSKPEKDRFLVYAIPSFEGSYADGRRINTCDIGDVVLVTNDGKTVGDLEDQFNLTLDSDYVYFKSTEIDAIL